MSNYALYIKERENKDIIEDNNGFATYILIDNKKGLQVQDVFVKKEVRRTGVARKYFSTLECIAKEQKCDYIITSVDTRTNNWEISKLSLETDGYKEIGHDPLDTEFIFFLKRINYGR